MTAAEALKISQDAQAKIRAIQEKIATEVVFDIMRVVQRAAEEGKTSEIYLWRSDVKTNVRIKELIISKLSTEGFSVNSQTAQRDLLRFTITWGKPKFAWVGSPLRALRDFCWRAKS